MNWKSEERVLYRNANIHSSVSPFATAMLVDGDQIAWLGEESAVAAHHDSADRVLDVNGAFISPVFVDSHSLALEDLSISEARQQAARVGIGAFHDFSKSDAQKIDHSILDQAGSLIYAFRNLSSGAPSGLIVDAGDAQLIIEALSAQLPVSLTSSNTDLPQLLGALTQVATSIGQTRLKAADIRVDGLSEITKAQLHALEEFGISIVANPGEMRTGATATTVGASVAFGSFNASVNNPWESIRSAVFELPEQERMTARAAFSAATRGGWRAIGRGHIGVLAPGAAAHFTLWDAGDVVVQTPDERVAGWSTDPRSGTPGLPDVSPGVELPVCLRTVIAGSVVFDSGALPA